MVFETIPSAVGVSGQQLRCYVQSVRLVPPRTDTRVAGPGRLVRVTETPRRVVIAEDEALIRLDLKEMLEEDGYQVVGEAGDGETAVKLALELKPDLVI